MVTTLTKGSAYSARPTWKQPRLEPYSEARSDHDVAVVDSAEADSEADPSAEATQVAAVPVAAGNPHLRNHT